MAKSKLFYFLSKIPKKDLMLFKTQLELKPSKRGKVLIKLLSQQMSGEDDVEKLRELLSPLKVVSEKQVRNLKSILFLKLLDFLAVRAFQKSSQKVIYVAKALNQIRVPQYYKAVIKRYRKEEGLSNLSLESLETNWKLLTHQITNSLIEKGREKIPYDHLLNCSEEAFVARTLYQGIAFFEAQKLWEPALSTPTMELWEGVIQKLDEGAWSHSILIQLYYLTYKLIRDPESSEHFRVIKSKLTQWGNQLAKVEAIRLYSAVINHCIRQINYNNSDFYAELFLIFQELISRNLLISNSRISFWHFKTIVTCGARTKAFKWTREFISEFKEYLEEENRSSVISFCEGLLAFQSKDYFLAERKMNLVLEEGNDPFWKLDARSYLLRIFYDTGDFTRMESQLSSYRSFINRNKHLGKERLQNYQEFIRFFRRLVRMDPNKQNIGLRLQRDIKTSRRYAGRSWLLEKLLGIYPNLKSGDLDEPPE